MAKVKYGPIIGSMSGSVGGSTYSRNRYGTYIRRRAIPVVSTTPAALAAKARFGAASQAYQSLSAAQKLAWNTWALTNPVTDRLGDPQALTGHAAFIGSWTRANFSGGTPLDEPPVIAAPAALELLVMFCDIGAGAFELNFTAQPLGANDQLWIYGAVADSSGIVYVKNLLRSLGLSAAAQASPLDCETLFSDKFGVLQVDQTCHVSVAVFNNVSFQVSSPLAHSAVVVTT